jgi:hypothetical protein
MKSNTQSDHQSAETGSKQSLIAESDLTNHLTDQTTDQIAAQTSSDTRTEWTPDTSMDEIAPLTPLESTDQSPYSALSRTDTLDVPFPVLPQRSKHKNDLRDLSSYAETHNIPVFPVRDLGIKKALQKVADWAISQREYKLEWIAFAAGTYACIYVFSGLIESLKHLPFKP